MAAPLAAVASWLLQCRRGYVIQYLDAAVLTKLSRHEMRPISLCPCCIALLHLHCVTHRPCRKCAGTASAHALHKKVIQHMDISKQATMLTRACRLTFEPEVQQLASLCTLRMHTRCADMCTSALQPGKTHSVQQGRLPAHLYLSSSDDGRAFNTHAE